MTALETIAVDAGIAAGTAADSARVAVAIAAAGAVADAFGAELGAMVIVRGAAICPLRNTPLQTRRIRHTRHATVRANPVLPRMQLSRSCCPVSPWQSTETARPPLWWPLHLCRTAPLTQIFILRALE